jgi:hypothetical protein
MTRIANRRVMGLALLLGACSSSGSASPDDGGAPGLDGGASAPDAESADGSFESPDAGAVSDCWQKGSIPDISSWGNAGSAYPAPTVSGDCEGTSFVVRSNGIPTFTFVPLTPNGLSAQNYTFRLPRKPTAAATTTSIPLLGAVAVTVTGLPIFGPTENPMDGYRDPVLDDTIANLLDDCNGHTAPGGTYHLHARPSCIIAKLGGDKRGLVVGWAADGYPILAPVVCTDAGCTATKTVKSSWKLNLTTYTTANRGPAWDIHSYVDGLGDLDQCNGLPITDTSSPYDYAYYVTDTFPYFMGCYHGTPVSLR